MDEEEQVGEQSDRKKDYPDLTEIFFFYLTADLAAVDLVQDTIPKITEIFYNQTHFF